MNGTTTVLTAPGEMEQRQYAHDMHVYTRKEPFGVTTPRPRP